MPPYWDDIQAMKAWSVRRSFQPEVQQRLFNFISALSFRVHVLKVTEAVDLPHDQCPGRGFDSVVGNVSQLTFVPHLTLHPDV